MYASIQSLSISSRGEGIMQLTSPSLGHIDDDLGTKFDATIDINR
jgi:hypothetical protein